MTARTTGDATARDDAASNMSSRSMRALEPYGAGLRDALGYCLSVYVAVRVGLTVVALAATALVRSNPAVDVPGWEAPVITPGWHNLVTAWERWDALWFLRIADSGYAAGDGSAAFFPLYPLMVRGVSFMLGGHPLAAGLIVSNVAFIAALVAVYALTAREFTRRVARRTVLYLAIFPTAFFFVAPYSESLFVALAAACLLSARLGRWPIAGLLGALAAATRSVGILLVLPLVAEAVLQARQPQERSRRRRRLLWGLSWSALTAAGTASYLAFWQSASGDWLAPFTEQQNWARRFSPPWETLVTGTGEAFRWIGEFPGGYHLLDWLLVVPILAAGIWVALRTRLPFALYTWANLLVPLAFTFGVRPFMSLPRFALPVFPVFWALARLSERRRGAHEAIIATSAAGLGVMTLLFVNWYWVF